MSFDEGGGYTSTLEINGDDTIDILSFEPPEPPLSPAMASRDYRRTKERIVKHREKRKTFVPEKPSKMGHFAGVQDLTDPSIGLPAATFGFESQRADWLSTPYFANVDEPEGTSYAAPAPPSVDDGGNWFGDIFDSANDAINPFAWFGSDPVRTMSGGAGGFGGILKAGENMMLIMVMMMMRD